MIMYISHYMPSPFETATPNNSTAQNGAENGENCCVNSCRMYLQDLTKNALTAYL